MLELNNYYAITEGIPVADMIKQIVMLKKEMHV
jgi:succinyl-CoA synthetase alpha subunit